MYTRIWLFLILSLTLSCNFRYNRLADYYNNNVALHQETADSLGSFIKTHNNKIIIRLLPVDGRLISFQYYFAKSNSYIPIEYDSALNRRDSDPGKTANIYVPLSVISNFNRSIYHVITADTKGIFFGYKYNIGGKKVYGILIYKNETTINQKNIIKRLSKNACIYEMVVP